MMKKNKSIMILVCVIICLSILYIFAKENKQEISEQEIISNFYNIVSIRLENVDRIDVKNVEGGDCTYIDVDGHWELENSTLRIDESVITGALGILLNFSSQDKYDEAKEVYGINENSPKIIISSNNSPTSFTVGDKTPDGQFNYIMVESDGEEGIYSLRGDAADMILLSKNDVAEKGFEKIDFPTMSTIKVVQKDYQTLLLQLDENKKEVSENLQGISLLKMEQPYNGMEVYSQNMVDKLLPTVTSLEFDELVENDAQDLTKYGLDNPYLSINIISSTGKIDVLIGNKEDGKYYAVNKGETNVFTIEPLLLEPFIDINPFSFMNKFINIIPIDSVEELVLSNGETNYVLRENEINGKIVAEDQFNYLYKNIVSLEIIKDLQGEFTPNENFLEISFYLKNHTQQTSKFFEYDPLFYAYYSDVSNHWFLVSKEDVDSVFTETFELSR